MKTTRTERLDAIERMADRVRTLSGYRSAKETEEALDKIADAIELLVEIVREIAREP